MLEGSPRDRAAATTDDAPVDLAQLIEILGENDPSEMRDHFELFFTHFPTLLDRVEAAFVSKNIDDMAVAAHTAKGAAGMAAATVLHGSLMRIESAARGGAWPEIASLVPSIRPEYARVQAFVANGGLTENKTQDTH